MDLPESEERYIRDYVNTQSPDDDQAGLVQKIGSRRVLGRTHEIYDVHGASTRWWVITDPTNLYLQTDFPKAEHALTFHIGLGVMMLNVADRNLRTRTKNTFRRPGVVIVRQFKL
ncbi:hypothetical protein [Mycobacterium paragordonae]|uniref:Uncharacterized protein n=1 Tax=Mycobacterium paragordonae TaxID=1389713 RepID=A0AAJ1W6K5_9MYCO|nr:hypothetical protein [Mycobacterium paragordonae]MDP7739486.1 hypothetical protein [Mycobacterium paragordonae]PJE21517.1 MAG: hypothetical protein CK431_21400 [Mycobacterium sp.]